MCVTGLLEHGRLQLSQLLQRAAVRPAQLSRAILADPPRGLFGVQTKAGQPPAVVQGPLETAFVALVESRFVVRPACSSPRHPAIDSAVAVCPI